VRDEVLTGGFQLLTALRDLLAERGDVIASFGGGEADGNGTDSVWCMSWSVREERRLRQEGVQELVECHGAAGA
jgi:hypothetical protein